MIAHTCTLFFSLLALHLLVGNFSSRMAVSATAPFTEESPRPLKISDVRLSVSKFNPRIGERLEIGFSLSKEAAVTVKIFDPDFELVRALLENESKQAGPQKVPWDGKDLDGSLVPDEAYFFTIEAKDKNGNTDLYDPITFSGGEMYDVAQADFDKERNEVRYKLDHAGRVLVRMGVHRGPLLRTLVDWQPRLAGGNREPWDGKDASGLVNLQDDPSFVATIMYFTLPENSVLTVGNDKLSYNAYKTGRKTARPKKEDRGRTIMSNRPIAPHFSQPRTAYTNPTLRVTFPDVKRTSREGWPVLEEGALLRVDVDEKDRKAIKNRKTEVYFFVDNRFLVEEGDAQIPYLFRWNFSNLPEGEHVLTVNLLTDNDQIGTASKKIVVQKSQGAR